MLSQEMCHSFCQLLQEVTIDDTASLEKQLWTTVHGVQLISANFWSLADIMWFLSYQ